MQFIARLSPGLETPLIQFIVPRPWRVWTGDESPYYKPKRFPRQSALGLVLLSIISYTIQFVVAPFIARGMSPPSLVGALPLPPCKFPPACGGVRGGGGLVVVQFIARLPPGLETPLIQFIVPRPWRVWTGDESPYYKPKRFPRQRALGLVLLSIISYTIQFVVAPFIARGMSPPSLVGALPLPPCKFPPACGGVRGGWACSSAIHCTSAPPAWKRP